MDTATTADRLDMSAFLIAHAGMRQEFGLLARVAAQPLDADRARLVEAHIAMVLGLLHHHHTSEDDTIWPTLRTLVPEAGPLLDELETDHARLDPLLVAAGDTARPLADRAAALAELHALVNAHLDREEAGAVPLMQAHLRLDQWEAIGERANAGISKRDLPTVYGWFYSAGSDELRVAALAGVPAVVRVLFRMFWWPAYQRRARRIYGADAPASVR